MIMTEVTTARITESRERNSCAENEDR